MPRTAALLVPNTVEGRFYNALVNVPSMAAASVQRVITAAAGDLKDLQGNPLFNGSQAFLEQLLSNVINVAMRWAKV